MAIMELEDLEGQAELVGLSRLEILVLEEIRKLVICLANKFPGFFSYS